MILRRVVRLWAGIVVLSAILLMAEDCPAQTGLCDPDPCQGIPNAVADTCTEVSGACADASFYTCSCDYGYTWQDATNTCEGGGFDPCDPDPCGSIVNAVPASCTAAGVDDFSCDCDSGYGWQNGTNTCESLPSTCVGVVEFPDPNLEQAIRDAIPKPTGDIYATDLLGLTSLSFSRKGISDLSRLECCTALTLLSLWDNQIVDVSPLATLTSLTTLSLWDNQIVDVSPLATLTSLTTLDLYGNQIVDVSPLATLTSLTTLDLDFNQIVDVSPLADLTTLTELYLSINQIVDVSPLSGLTNLTELYLDENQIVDVCPLVDNLGLDSQASVSLASNPLSTTSCTVCIPQLEGRSVFVYHDCP